MIEVRPLADDTYEPAARWLSDPAINRWLTSVWRGRQVPVTMLALAARSEKNAIFVVHADGRPCGLVGLADIDPLDRVAMIWYLVDPEFAGRGAATEGIAQVTRHAFEQKGLRCVYAWIMEDNAPSRRVLEKNGYRFAGRLRGATDSGGRPVDRLYYDRVPGDKES